MKASERIAEIVRQVVDYRMQKAKAADTNGAGEFMMKITGITEADVAQSLLTDSATLISAIIAYLDEKGI